MRRVYLPKSINLEIGYWQQYRKEHVLPAIREDHSEEVPVTFFMYLFGRNYNMPLEVTGYQLRVFFPFIPFSILQNLATAKGMDFMKESIKKALKKYSPTVRRTFPSKDLLWKRTLLNSERYKTDKMGKIIGSLISTPIKGELALDDVWFSLIETLYRNIKTKKLFEGMSPFDRKYTEPVFRGKILDYADIFALVIFYEENKQYFAYTPDKRKLDVSFIDLKKQREIEEDRDNQPFSIEKFMKSLQEDKS